MAQKLLLLVHGRPHPQLAAAMTGINWHAMFIPAYPIAEVMVRGTIIYLLLFLFLRVLPRREMGGMGVADLLIIVLIADAAQNAMAGEYKSITEGLVLLLTMLFWAYIVDWLDYRFPQLHIAGSAPLLLVRNGRLLHRNMEQEQITEEELMSQLRHQGLDSVAGVKRAYMESDGRVSVIMAPKRPGLRSE